MDGKGLLYKGLYFKYIIIIIIVGVNTFIAVVILARYARSKALLY